MAFTAVSYSELSSGAYLLDDLLKDFNNRISAAIAEPASIVSAMTAFATEWGTIQGIAQAMADADPTNMSKQNLASHVGNLVADYGTILARAQALATAVQSI